MKEDNYEYLIYDLKNIYTIYIIVFYLDDRKVFKKRMIKLSIPFDCRVAHLVSHVLYWQWFLSCT